MKMLVLKKKTNTIKSKYDYVEDEFKCNGNCNRCPYEGFCELYK